MKLPTFSTENEKRFMEEVHLMRLALQSIAASLERATAVPEVLPLPAKPLGPECVGSYAQSIQDLEGEDANVIREQLHQAGLSDHAIEEQIVRLVIGEED